MPAHVIWILARNARGGVRAALSQEPCALFVARKSPVYISKAVDRLGLQVAAARQPRLPFERSFGLDRIIHPVRGFGIDALLDLCRKAQLLQRRHAVL